jgi:cyclic pyranopterin phosphate synthase
MSPAGAAPELRGPSAEPRDLLQRPLRDLRISVTDRCNFRCPYCMPADVFGERYTFLPRAEILSYEELERIARVFVSLGVRKLRLTGGEPLLRADLASLVARLARIEGVEDLALTTNGYLLAERAQELRAAGLARVTLSMDSVDEATFARMNGRGLSLARVLAGLAAAERAGLAPIKINTVVVRGMNDGELVALAERFRGSGHVLRLIEFMDVGTRNHWEREQVVPAAEMLARIAAVFPLEPLEPTYPGEVARRYRYRDGAGELGIIASVSQPFCGQCTRARLSADGRLVTCLFAAGGTDLKALLRGGASDAQLREVLAALWRAREDRYSELRTAAAPRAERRIEMYEIGG